jgi:hypothetical protein
MQFLEAYNSIEDMIKYDELNNENSNEHMKADKERIKQISKD